MAAGRPIAAIPTWMAGITHPGVVTLPLVDAPSVATRLVWRADTDDELVHAVVDIAADTTRDPRRPRP